MGLHESTNSSPRAVRRSRTLRRLAIGTVVVLGVTGFAGVMAHAGDDDDDQSIDTKIINGVLDGMGLNTSPPIDYRERSPLVVPPKLDLPKPEDDTTAEKSNPAWPKDADAQRKKEAKRRQTRGYVDWEKESRPLRPDELDRGRRASASTEAAPDEAGRKMSPSELGFSFSGLANTFGLGKKEETAKFVKEPPRNSLIEPPEGYRTPSAEQPYGIGVQPTVNNNTIATHGEPTK
jgi:hypothetical protein